MKTLFLKLEGVKTGIPVYYYSSFLPGHSLIFSPPTLSKLEVNEETGTVCQLNFTNELLERYLIKPTQIIIYFRNWRDEFLEELQ